MIEQIIRNATVNILKSGDLTEIFIHANIVEQTTMPTKSGKTVQYCRDASYSWATLNYKLSENVILYLE